MFKREKEEKPDLFFFNIFIFFSLGQFRRAGPFLAFGRRFWELRGEGGEDFEGGGGKGVWGPLDQF